MRSKTMVILSGLKSLVILPGVTEVDPIAGDGSPSLEAAPENQYRIRGHHVEFRTVAPNGPPRPDRSWRTLTGDELALHFALKTPVADWLDKTLYAQQRTAA
jgi:hypothetical protein